MQFQVPQNITMEDRIVGPLTVMQFTIVTIFGFIALFILNITSIPQTGRYWIAGVVAFFGLGIAMGKFNDQPLYRFFKYILFFILRPKTRVWRKIGGGEAQLVSTERNSNTKGDTKVRKVISKEDITRIATVVDSRGVRGIIPKDPGSKA